MQTPFTNLTFCIRTFGCQMNKHDSERIAGMLEGLGALPVEAIEDADIVAFMTCCVREAADTRLYGQVASLKNVPLRTGSPLAKRVVAVGGCIGQRDGEKLVEEQPHLDVVFGTHNLGSLPRLIEAAVEEGGQGRHQQLAAAADHPSVDGAVRSLVRADGLKAAAFHGHVLVVGHGAVRQQDGDIREK